MEEGQNKKDGLKRIAVILGLIVSSISIIVNIMLLGIYIGKIGSNEKAIETLSQEYKDHTNYHIALSNTLGQIEQNTNNANESIKEMKTDVRILINKQFNERH